MVDLPTTKGRWKTMEMHASPEREELLAGLIAMRDQFEERFIPQIVGPVMSLRLTVQQLKILTLLVAEPHGSTVQKLSKVADVSLATMSGIVDRLEGHGMIYRTPDPLDQRVRRVNSTELGHETIVDLLMARPEFEAMPLSRVSTEDLRALKQGVGALLRAVSEHSGPDAGLSR